MNGVIVRESLVLLWDSLHAISHVAGDVPVPENFHITKVKLLESFFFKSHLHLSIKEHIYAYI